MELNINQSPTKYMAVIKARKKYMATTITIVDHEFERVEEFMYLESTITHRSDISYEIKQALAAGNRADLAQQNYFAHVSYRVTQR